MRQKFYLCALLLTIPSYASAIDLSGFYRCSGTKTVLSTRIGSPVSLPPVEKVSPTINSNGSTSSSSAPVNNSAPVSSPVPAPVPPPTNDPNAANPAQAPPPATSSTAPVKIKINPPATASGTSQNSATTAPPPQSSTTSSGSSVQSDAPVLSAGANDNAIPVAALLNLRILEGGDNTYVYQQMNDDGSVLWGLFYYDNNHLVGGFQSRTKQLKEYQGAASLNVSPEDGTFAGQFYIENVVKGNVTCSKL